MRQIGRVLLGRCGISLDVISTLRFYPLGDIQIVLSEVHLFPGTGGHRLTFQLQVTGTWLRSGEPTASTPALLIGTVLTEQPHSRWLCAIEPQVLALRGYQAAETVAISLTDEQLLALEDARDEGDIVLRIKFQATLLAAFDSVHQVAEDEVPLRIPRARWLELIDQAGTEVGIIIRVASPLTDRPPHAANARGEDTASMLQATKRLRQARAELTDHQWEQCVATCRRVLENVGRLTTIPSAKKVFDVTPEQRTQEQRWAAIYYDVKSMASAAHHDDGTTDGFTWTRSDAAAILAATAGLLHYFTNSPQ